MANGSARRTDGVRHHVERGEDHARHRAVPRPRPAGRPGRAVQGAEHGAQLGGHAVGARDRAGPGRAGARGRASSPKSAMNPILLKPTGERTSQVVVDGTPVRGDDRDRVPRRTSPSCSRSCSTRSPTCGRASTSCCARARAARPRSTCSTTTSSTSASRTTPACPRSWSATSTSAACSPRSTAPWRCCPTTTERSCAAS